MLASIQKMKKKLIKYNQPTNEIPISNYKTGGTSAKLPLISWFFTIPFHYTF